MMIAIAFTRNYALRRVTDAFKENKNLSEAADVEKQFKFAKENLDIIKRQVNRSSSKEVRV